MKKKEIKEEPKVDKSKGVHMTPEELKEYNKVWSDMDELSERFKKIKNKK